MKVFSINEVAAICKVAPKTVRKWFDSGKLIGYSNPGGEPRIPREYLIKFMKENGFMINESEVSCE